MIPRQHDCINVFLTEPKFSIITIAAITIGLLSVALVFTVAAIVAGYPHIHGKSFLHAVIFPLSIMLHMLYCYSKEKSGKQSESFDVSLLIS